LDHNGTYLYRETSNLKAKVKLFLAVALSDSSPRAFLFVGPIAQFTTRQLRPTKMDLNVALHPGLSVAAHIARERDKDANMLNNNAWRLGHSKQPKKQPKKEQKALTPLKVDVPTAPRDSGDRRRQPSWLKARSVSRPDTPVGGIATAVEDTGKLS
jgi:hypothetical protein